MAVGAHKDDDVAVSGGSVYLYQRVGSTWSFFQKVTAFDGAEATSGQFLALHDDTLVVGPTPMMTTEPAVALYAYVYNGTDWELEQKKRHLTVTWQTISGMESM